MTLSEGGPQQPAWSCDASPRESAPLPAPIHLDNGLYNVPGIGHFDQEGQQIIGLPAGSMRSLTRALVDGSYFAQLDIAIELDTQIEQAATED